MTPAEIEQELKTLSQRTTDLEQILPRVLTKEDLQAAMVNVATKDDLKRFATKDDLKNFMTKQELQDELRKAIEPLATKQFVLDLIHVTRREIRQVDDKVTAMGEDVKGIAELLANVSVQVGRLNPGAPRTRSKKR